MYFTNTLRMLKDLIFILFMHTKDLVGETWVEKVR